MVCRPGEGMALRKISGGFVSMFAKPLGERGLGRGKSVSGQAGTKGMGFVPCGGEGSSYWLVRRRGCECRMPEF